MLSDHSEIRLDRSQHESYRTYTNIYRLDDTLLNDEWITEGIKQEIKKFQELDEIKNTYKKAP
jgi:hypothetical protein